MYPNYYDFLSHNLIDIINEIIVIRNGSAHRSLTPKEKHLKIKSIIIDNKILIELKSKEFVTKGDEKTFWHYLKATNYKLGLLINFGPEKLEIKRRIYDEARI